MYQLNAYRVLMARACQDMVICVPKGDPKDPTKIPDFYDETCNYLKLMGLIDIDAS